MTPEQENEMMLSSILGISEAEASERLNKKIAVSAESECGAKLASAITAQLERTVHIVSPAHCDLEIAIGTAQQNPLVPGLMVGLDSESLLVSEQVKTPLQAQNVHGLLLELASCYVAGTALSKL